MYRLFYLYLIPATVAGSVAFFAMLLCDSMLRRLHASAQRTLGILNFSFFVVPVGWLLRALWKLPTFTPANILQQAADDAQQTVDRVLIATYPTVQIQAPSMTEQVQQWGLAILPWIWLIGAVAIATVQFCRYIHFFVCLKRLSVPADVWVQGMVKEIWKENGQSRFPQIYLCEGLPTPFLMGVFQPKLYLPMGWDYARYSLALRHEVQHTAQRDLLLKLITVLVCTVHWFNPLCHRFSQKLADICELACDEKATASMSKIQKKEYAQLLLQTAREGLPTAVSGFGGRKPSLRGRLEALFMEKQMDKKKRFAVTLLAISGIVLSACSSLGTSVAVEQSDVPQSNILVQPTPEETPASDLKAENSLSEVKAEEVSQEEIVDEYEFCWPVPNHHFISRQVDEKHSGTDIVAPKGNDVVAMAAGTVEIAEYSGGYGYHVKVVHDDKTYTSYSHLSELKVSAGQTVEQGEVVGLVGSTGYSTGDHCCVRIVIDENYYPISDWFSFRIGE